jgi:TatD DNase family protein
MRICDTHSHIFDEAFDDDRAEVVHRAVEGGVCRIVLPAIDSESHDRVVQTLAEYPDTCIGAMGVHPTSITAENIDQELDHAARLLDSGVEWRAIGEIGLDYYWSCEHIESQHRAFRTQLDWALSRNLPVIIHTRSAWDDMTALLEEYSGRGLRGVMHAFCGSIEQYHRIKKVGDFVFGIGGVATYKNGGVAELVAQMSLDDLVLETDAPYLTPTPYRGKRNEPSYIIHTARRVADLLERPIDEVCNTTYANACRLFGL